MTKGGPIARLPPDESSASSASVPPRAVPEAPGADFRTISQDVLFTHASDPLCDACGATLDHADDEGGYEIAGQGVYLWARGDEVRFEPAPLCAACASAIGMTALARWEIEEEEG